MRREIENRLWISATDNYGLSEIIGPGVAGECQHKDGMHIFEDAFLPEIIDPDTGAELPPGSVGELGAYYAYKGSVAYDPLQDQGHYQSGLFSLCMRPDHGPNEKNHGTQ